MRSVQNQRQLKLANLVKILDCMKRNGVMVKSEIARALGLSVVTIGKICDDLADAGILEYTEVQESSGGRKPVGIRFVADSRYIMALDLCEQDHALIAVLNLRYAEISSVRFNITATWGINDFLDYLGGHIAAVLDGIDIEHVLGMCVAIPAIFNSSTKIIEECNTALFKNQRLTQRIESIFPKPVIMENDANLAGLGHYDYNGVENLLYVHFTDGVGLGIVQGGKIYRGHAGYAGELANMGVPGFHGDWTTVEKALSEEYLKKVMAELPENPDCALNRRGLLGGTNLPAPIAEYIKSTIGRVMAVLIDLFNPEQLILGGRSFFTIKSYLHEIIEYAQKYSMTMKRDSIEIVEAPDDESLVIKGCCERFYQEWVMRGPIIAEKNAS